MSELLEQRVRLLQLAFVQLSKRVMTLESRHGVQIAAGDTPKLLTINEAAHVAGRSRRTIHTWIKEGKVERVNTPGGRGLIVAASLLPKAVPFADERLLG